MPKNSDKELSLDMGGGGIKQKYEVEEVGFYREITISETTDIVLFMPDAGKAKDEYFIPNLHNGLFRITAYLKEQGFSTGMICTDLDDMDDAWEKIRQYKPPIIGFSTYYNTMGKDLANIYKAKEVNPNSIVVVGGFEASLNKQWLELNEFVDIIVLGEGELPLAAIIRGFRKYNRYNRHPDKQEYKKWLAKEMEKEGIDGVYILGHQKVEYYKQKRRISKDIYREINRNAFIKHIKESPVEKYWELTDKMFDGQKEPFFRFVTSDNCPWKCKFCQSSIYYSTIAGKEDRSVMFLDEIDVIDIIQRVSDVFPQIRCIYIDDENFLINRKRASEIAGKIVALKNEKKIRNELAFLSRSRTNQIDHHLCLKLKDAGWEVISVGSESYSQAELDFIGKRLTVADNKKAVKILYETGLLCAENYILYTPHTTMETFYESAKHICENIMTYNVDGASTLFITPLPGTDFWGDGTFEIMSEKSWVPSFFKNYVHFISRSSGFEYLGSFVKVPGTGITLPHPEIVLIEDAFMRTISLKSVEKLPAAIDYLSEFLSNKGSVNSRKFITLANLFSSIDQIYEKTKTPDWQDLRDLIIKVVRNL